MKVIYEGAFDRKTDRQLRIFACALATAVCTVTAISSWSFHAVWPYPLSVSGAVLVVGLAFPRILWPIELVFGLVARSVMMVVTYITLALFFFLILTPSGFLLRLAGKDTLGRRFDSNKPTYWTPVDPTGSANRPSKPY